MSSPKSNWDGAREKACCLLNTANKIYFDLAGINSYAGELGYPLLKKIDPFCTKIHARLDALNEEVNDLFDKVTALDAACKIQERMKRDGQTHRSKLAESRHSVAGLDDRAARPTKGRKNSARK